MYWVCYASYNFWVCSFWWELFTSLQSHVLVQRSLVLYSHLQCSYEQKSFSVAPKVSLLQWKLSHACTCLSITWTTSEKFQEAYVSSCNISIDESLLLWKGRLSFKQYISLKRAWNPLCCVRIVETHFHSKSTLVEKMWPKQYKTFPFLRDFLLTLCNLCWTKGTICTLIIGIRACLCTSTFIAKEP